MTAEDVKLVEAMFMRPDTTTTIVRRNRLIHLGGVEGLRGGEGYET
jgi:hypothetical protein